MATNGLLIAVRWEWDGTELVADALAGAVSITVLDPTSLSIDESIWLGGTGPYVVTDVDEDTGIVAIGSGLSADMDTATEVAPDVGGTPARVWVAEVNLPDGDEPIEVPLTIHDLAVMPEGEYDPPVGIIISDDLQSVIDLPGNMPVIDGGLIPPDSLPIPPLPPDSDGQVPPSSPQPQVTGGIGAFFLRWAPPPNNDPMRFEVHVSDTDGFAPTTATVYTETSAYSATVRNLTTIDPNTGELAKFQYGVNYYFRVVAKDADGSAGPSLVDFGQMMQVTGPDIAARTVVAENIVTGTITGDLFSGSIILGSTISTGAMGQDGNITGARIDLGPAGFGIYDSDGNLTTRFPIDPNEDAFVQAHFHMFSAEVDNNFTLHGVNNAIAASSKITLANGIQAPTTPPNVGFTYDTVQLDVTTQVVGTGSYAMGTFALDPSQIKNMAWDTANACWNVIQERSNGIRMWRFNNNGSIKQNAFTQTPWVDDFKGFTRASVADQGYIMAWTGDRWIVFGGAEVPAGWIINTNQDPLLGWDAVNSRYMLIQNAPGSIPKTVQIRRFTIANGVCTSTGVTTTPAGLGRNNRMNGIYYGAADFGVNRYVSTVENDANVQVWTDTGVRQNTNGSYQEWTEPIASNGFGYDGAAFWSVDATGKMTKYTKWTWPEYPTTTFVGMSAYDSRPAGDQANPWPGQTAGTHETPVGLLAQTSAKRRAKLVITVPVTNDSGGNDDQDKWKVYWARTTGAVPTAALMKFVSTLGSNAVPQSITILQDPTGATPPGGIGGQAGAGNNFPAGNPARLVSSALDGGGLPMIDLRGDGAGRVGPFKWDITGKDLSKNGLMVSYSSASTNNVATGTFVIVTGWAIDAMPTTAPEFNGGAPGGQFTILVPGVYLIIASVNIASTGSTNPTRKITAIFKNNSEIVREDTASGGVSGGNPSTIGTDVVSRLAPTDTVSIQVWQNSGTTASLSANPGHRVQFIKLSD